MLRELSRSVFLRTFGLIAVIFTVGGNFEAAANSSVLVQGANASFASSLPAGQEGASAMPSTKIYRNSSGFAHLEAANKISPGSAIQNKTSGEFCSVGWFFDFQDAVVLSTAGHCGEMGDDFVFFDTAGRANELGRVVYSDYRGVEDLGVDDFALIEVEDESVIATTQPLDERLVSDNLYYEIDSTIEFHEFDRICGVGFRSGLSCGPFERQGADGELYFRRISDSGDSGGPVFGVLGNALVPLAQGSAGRDDDATLSLNQLLLPKVDSLGLSLRVD